jgi:hypothetical protein
MPKDFHWPTLKLGFLALVDRVRIEVLAGSDVSARSILRRYPLGEIPAHRLNAMENAASDR